VPELCRFLGIVIYMFFDDHEPAHFHARYSGWRGRFLLNGALLDGHMPPRVLGLIVEWANLHHVELRENWNRARAGLPLEKIDPLQ
jgi:hypothetical protein